MREIALSRLKRNFQQSVKYLSLVFNDFFILALVFMLGALMFWYAQTLKIIPQNRWYYRPILAAVLCLPMLTGRLVTLFKPADQQFLITMDHEIKDYLRLMLGYSMIVPALLIVGLWSIMLPFATLKAGINSFDYLILLFSLLVLKFDQLVVKRNQLLDPAWQVFNQIFLLQAIVLVFLGTYQSLILFAASVLYLSCLRVSVKYFDWLKAIELEQQRKATIYLIFSMFTDVKERKVNVKRRKYLDIFLKKNWHGQTPTEFLLSRSLLRNPEYLNLLVRMTIFALLVSFLVQSAQWSLAIACLVSFLTAYQLAPIAHEYDRNLLFRIYPIQTGLLQKDASLVAKKALLLQSVLVGLVNLLLYFAAFGLANLAVVVFAFIIGQIYLPYKIKQVKQRKVI